MKLAGFLPVSKGLMIPYFASIHNTATSATAEAELKNVKKGLFKHKNQPMRVDRFITRHIFFIEGKMRLCPASRNCTRTASLDCKNTQVTQQPEDEIREAADARRGDDNDPIENWRGLAVPPKKKT